MHRILSGSGIGGDGWNSGKVREEKRSVVGLFLLLPTKIPNDRPPSRPVSRGPLGPELLQIDHGIGLLSRSVPAVALSMGNELHVTRTVSLN